MKYHIGMIPLDPREVLSVGRNPGRYIEITPAHLKITQTLEININGKINIRINKFTIIDSSEFSFSREITAIELEGSGVLEWSSVTAKRAFNCKIY